MIDKYVDRIFLEPPEDSEFEQEFGELIADVEQSLDALLKLSTRARPERQAYLHGSILYIKTQAIIRVLLNYKICVEFGLPLHPTRYFDFFNHEKDPARYSEEMKKTANRLYLEAIATARDVYRLRRDARGRLAKLREDIPPEITDFVYVNSRDKYTWRASGPDTIKKLAKRIKEDDIDHSLVLGAAHGCIRSGLLLANLLETDLYFIRFSAFKRNDKQPIISGADRRFFEDYSDKNVLVFDEDVAKGVTLRTFHDSVKDLFETTKTAAVLRHFISPYSPDFVGELFFD